MDDCSAVAKEGFFWTLIEERSMPIESFYSVIAVGFVTVWLMVGQFSLVKP